MIKQNQGFTLLEVMIAVAIIGILAAIAYPSYQSYVIRTKRADMMVEMQNVGRQIESRKLAAGRGGYNNVDITDLTGGYPRQGQALYTLAIADLATGNWVLTAAPVATGMQASDGVLTLSNNGRKCRATTCGMGDEWRN